MKSTPSTEGSLSPSNPPPLLRKDWRFYTGMAALLLALVLPLFGLAVPWLGLPTAVSAVLIGGLVAGGPEVLMVMAAALLGKETLHVFLYQAKRALGRALLVSPVSKVRYYTGLTIAVVSMLPFYLYGYFPEIMPPGSARIYTLAGSDLSFILSIFLMGGEFWEKLRRLFVWEGKA
jgi:hypothetical protein